MSDLKAGCISAGFFIINVKMFPLKIAIISLGEI